MYKVLVMDDSKIFRLKLKELLVTNGYEVMEAIDGQDAWEQLSSGAISPDFLMLDVNTPRLDGVALCEKLFEAKICEGKPIILVTTESNPDLKERAKKCGVRAWILKPIQSEKLLSTLAKVLKV
jgi:two-component system chemotaxis response regulator CheY